MANPSPVQVSTLRNLSPVLFARVVDSAGNNITQAAIAAIAYSVYLLDKDWPQDRDNRTAVTGHSAGSVTVADAVLDTLETSDSRWDVDVTGYNFRHQIDVSSNACFAVAGRHYLVEYVITPMSGQAIVVQFVVRVL